MQHRFFDKVTDTAMFQELHQVSVKKCGPKVMLGLLVPCMVMDLIFN